MPFKMTYSMGINGDDIGFRETWWCNADTDDILSIFARFGPVRVARQQLLGMNYAIVEERVVLKETDTGVPVTHVGLSNEVYLPGAATKKAVESGVSLLCEATTSDRKYHKKSYLGGPWHEIFPGDNVYDPNPAGSSWQTRFNSFVAALIQAKAGWRHQVPTDPKAIITGYTFSAVTGNTTYTLDATTPWEGVLNKPVRVAVDFPTGHSALDGVQLVVFTSPTSATTAKPRPARPFSLQGVMTFYTYTVLDIGTLNVLQQPGTFVGQRPVERKRGRPIFSKPGRLPARIRW